MFINGRFIPLGIYFAADDGGLGGGGGGGNPDNNTDGDDTGGQGGDDNQKTELDKLKEQIQQMKDQHQRELDRYRNEKGKLQKQLDKLQEENMSEEEKLKKRQQELEQRERELKVKELEATKAAQVAEKELDKRLAKFIDVNADMSEDDVVSQVEELKSIQNALREEVIDEFKNKGSIINSGGDRGGYGSNKAGLFGKELAKQSNKTYEQAEEAQKHYFQNT